MPATKRKIGAFAKRFVKKRAATAARTSTKRKTATAPARKKRRVAAPRLAYSHSAITHGKIPMAVPSLVGEFTNIPSINRFTVQTSSTQKEFLMVFYSPTDVGAISIDATTGITDMHLLPHLTQANPQQIRAQRLSVSIRNNTIAQNVGGTVRVLNTSQHFDIAWSTSNYRYMQGAAKDQLVALMESSPNARSYSGHAFTQTREIHAPPACLQQFREYNTFHAYSIATEDDAHNGALYLKQGNNMMASNMIIIEFAPSAVTNTYDIAVHRSDACRFAQGSVLSAMATGAPPGNEAAFTQSVQLAQRSASSNPVQFPRFG